MVADKKERGPFSSISFPTPLIDEIEKIVKEFGYWPNKTAFIREAVMEKFEEYRKKIETSRNIAEETEIPAQH